MLQRQARLIYGDKLQSPLKNIYFVGDNVCTDIFGANLYHRYLARRRCQESREDIRNHCRSPDHLFDGIDDACGAETCYSILVKTGVHSGDADHPLTLNHSPRDFLPIEKKDQEPTMLVQHVLEAVNSIFQRENFI